MAEPLPLASGTLPAPEDTTNNHDLTSSSSNTTSSSSLSSSSRSTLFQEALPVVPTLAVTDPSNYGRMNAENESNLRLLPSVPEDGALKWREKQLTPTASSPSSSSAHAGGRSVCFSTDADADTDNTSSPNTDAKRRFDAMQDPNHSQRGRDKRQRSPTSPDGPPFLSIPPEIVDAIFSHLSAHDLAILASTCHALRKYAYSERYWYRHVQENVPGLKLTTPGPFANYRELYAAHDPLWFLPKYKVWFCDRDLTGKLIIARYDPTRGCIDGYQLVATGNRTGFQPWAADNQVIIHGFEPQVKLHLDKPVLHFPVRDRVNNGASSTSSGASRFADEMPMKLELRSGGMHCNFLLTRALPPEEADRRLATEFPYENIWPPPVIPARHHVSGVRTGQAVTDLGLEDRPRCRSQVSDQAFRIRQWMELTGSPPILITQQDGSSTVPFLNSAARRERFLRGRTPSGVHIGEEIITYSTLDPSLYTPTATRPWRGIWVGDYSGHGCEFLLINQPDDPPATDEELGLVREDYESDEAWETRRLDARIYRGRLEAIKLTGDPNVPRGEYTFVVDDMGPEGQVGVATDPPFDGARVVKSKGHVAATGFLRDKFIESQLILIGPNRLAQYWVGFGHISFFDRIDIDSYTSTE